ncbi:MAG: DNA alkylation repair protein [Candidatus Woesearchaeota archaeon]|nr:MAG: DNA alkylation repair protein [Candidatus Woesearchaeota archaeon]
MYQQIIRELERYARPEKVNILSSFFKTGKGEYGEGDQFIGVSVPDQRIVAKQFKSATFSEVKKLLASKIHEHRLTALLILTYQFASATTKEQEDIVHFYLANATRANNWDLVDCSAGILGKWLLDKERTILYTLAKSANLWERRISIVATHQFIKHKQFEDIFSLAKIHLSDTHDLMHKAVGWMLREVGKQDEKALTTFLEQHINVLPRTTLRYAIERFEETKRMSFLKR